MPDQVERGQALEWVLGKIAAAAKKTAPKSSIFRTTVEHKAIDKKNRLAHLASPVPKFEPAKPASFKPPEKITTERKSKEIELWHQWNNNGRKPKDLDPLLKTFNNMITKRLNQFRRAEVPTSAIAHKLKDSAVEAFKTWDPKKGGALNTWLQVNLRRGQRYVDSNKNATYSPENITQHIGAYNALKAELREKIGFEPDAHAIHDHLLENGHAKESFARLSLKDIKRLEKEQRRSLISSTKDTDETAGIPHLSSRAEEVKLLIIPELSQDERVVHEYSFGLNGKSQLKPGDIAKKLKMDNSKISKLRTSILKKMQKYMGAGDD